MFNVFNEVFLSRIFVSPMEDPRLAIVTVVALPVNEACFGQLADNHKAKSSGGYPCILLDDGRNNPVTVGPRAPDSAGEFGLPSVPVLCIQVKEYCDRTRGILDSECFLFFS